eukprot:5341743-Heterocapsa_arctica.AAC.1
MLDVNLFVSLQGIRTPPIPLGKRGKQGATETPCCWNFLFDFILTPLLRDWSSKGFGVDLEDGAAPVTHLVWADDVWWFSCDFNQFMNMSQSLTYALGDGSLSWKPDSLGFLVNEWAIPLVPPSGSAGAVVLDRSSSPCFLP